MDETMNQPFPTVPPPGPLPQGSRFKLQLGDIVAMDVDAVVNSTDETLLAGGPVHVAIHKAAGPHLGLECQEIGDCPPGEARITGGYDLMSPYVIHTVAPMWENGQAGELEALTSCYRNSLRLAKARGIRSIAFPSIGSGLQPQIPLDLAAPTAVRTILAFLEANPLPERVIMVCYNAAAYQAHQKALKEALP
jgi:O-acetyl-ADP-ribose deacetylase (regulator of RNase III)